MIYNADISLLQFLLVLLIWTLIVFTMKFLTTHNRWIKRWVIGNPKQLSPTATLMFKRPLRIVYPHRICRLNSELPGLAIFARSVAQSWKQNGQLTITQKGDATIKYPLIMDGQINSEALELIDQTEEWLLADIEQQGYSLQQIYMANS